MVLAAGNEDPHIPVSGTGGVGDNIPSQHSSDAGSQWTLRNIGVDATLLSALTRQKGESPRAAFFTRITRQ